MRIFRYFSSSKIHEGRWKPNLDWMNSFSCHLYNLKHLSSLLSFVMNVVFVFSDVFVDCKPVDRHYEPHPCNCKVPEPTPLDEGEKGPHGCSDDNCLNRMVFIECNPNTCPCGEICRNQRIQRHDWAEGLEKFVTEERGYGVRTSKSISAGKKLGRYVRCLVGV